MGLVHIELHFKVNVSAIKEIKIAVTYWQHAFKGCSRYLNRCTTSPTYVL